MRKLFIMLLLPAVVSFAADATDKKTNTAKSAKDESKKARTGVKRNKKSAGKSQYSSFLSQLPEAERKRLEQLYRQDPKAFQREIRNRIAAWKRDKMARESKETYVLIRAYQQEKDPKKQEELKKKLAELTRKQFMKRLHENKIRIRKMEKVLADLKEKNANREKNADKIVEERVRYLTTDPSLRW
jgi:hypothetical protein